MTAILCEDRASDTALKIQDLHRERFIFLGERSVPYQVGEHYRCKFPLFFRQLREQLERGGDVDKLLELTRKRRRSDLFGRSFLCVWV
jgi:hypothetical protein